MKELRYPLIVSDFDGTLVQKDHKVGKESKKAIEEYIQNGGKFAISTGRLPAGILPQVKELGLKGMLCCCQGSIIMDIESEKRILNGKLPYETGLKIVKKMEELGLHIQIYGEKEYYCNIDDEPLHLYEEAVGAKAIVVNDMPMSAFIEKNHFQTHKVLAMVLPEDNERIMNELKLCNFENCTITKSAKFMIEVINANYSKGTAVQFLAKHYNVPIENTIAIGDQWNDLEMIKAAGLGIAVKNADDLLKSQAKLIYDFTNNENAVGKIIQQLAYKEV